MTYDPNDYWWRRYYGQTPSMSSEEHNRVRRERREAKKAKRAERKLLGQTPEREGKS